MSIDVINLGIAEAFHCHFHATARPFTGRRDHVDAVGRCAIADDLAINFGATGLGMFKFFKNHNT